MKNSEVVAMKLPLFRGTTIDTLSTLGWVESVDRQKEASNWSEVNTARWAVEAKWEKAAKALSRRQ